MMRGRIILTFGVLTVLGPLAMAACSSKPSLAWCADLNAQGRIDCDSVSFAQCQETVSGLGGSCLPNPRRAGREPPRSPQFQ